MAHRDRDVAGVFVARRMSRGVGCPAPGRRLGAATPATRLVAPSPRWVMLMSPAWGREEGKEGYSNG